ncbi:hypothetical protein ACX93W_12590 [Paenibacillus sp. CAU 1782]
MQLTYIYIGIVLMAVIGTLIGLGVWTYRDARARGLEAGMWTAIVVLVPNLLGFLLYMLIARKQHKVLCPSCSQKTEASKPFCSNCGSNLCDHQDMTNFAAASVKKTGKTPLVVALACVGITVATMIGAVVSIGIQQPEMFTSKNVSLFQTQTMRPGLWKLSFRYFDGEKAQAFTIKDGKPQTFRVNAEITKGEAELGITVGGEEVQRISLNELTEEFTWDLSPYPDKSRVVITLYGEKSSGKINMNWKE